MKKNFTAEEFFRYLKSFSGLFVWEGGDHETGLYISMEPRQLEIFKRKNTYAITGEITEAGHEFYQEGGFSLNGNNFQCEIKKHDGWEEVLAQSDCSPRPMRFELTEKKIKVF